MKHQHHCTTTSTPRMKVPKSKEGIPWLLFCLGENEIDNDIIYSPYYINHLEEEGIECENSSSDDEEEEQYKRDTTTATASSSPIPIWKKKIITKYDIPSNGYDPTTKLMSQFDQIIIRRLLSHYNTYSQRKEEW